jgi:hypothetical protein
MRERASLVIKAAASAILRETFLCTSVEIFFGHCSSPWYAMDRSSKASTLARKCAPPTPPPLPTAAPPGRAGARRRAAVGPGDAADRQAAVAARRSAGEGSQPPPAQQRSDSLLAPLCGAAGLRLTAGSAVRRSRAPSHYWLRCAALQGFESRLAPLCGAAALGSAVRRSRAPTHGWLRCVGVMGGGGEMGRWEDGGRSPLCGAAALRFKPGSAVRHSSVTSRPHSTFPTSFLVPQFGHQYALRCAAKQGTKSRLAPLCGAAALRVTAGSAVRRSRAPSHGWLRCAAQQGSESRLAPLCGAAGLRVTAGSAVRRSRAPSHCWLRCAAHGTTRPAAATPDAAPQHAVRRRAVRRVGLPLTDDNGSPADAPGL